MIPAEPTDIETPARQPDGHLRWLSLVLLGTAYVFLVSSYVSIAVNSISMGLMAAAWLGMMAVERRWTVARTPLDLFFLGFVIAQAVSTIFSSDPLQSLVLSKRLLLVGLVYFFASIVTTEGLSKRMVALLLSTAAIVAMIGVMKLLFGNPEENVRLGIFRFYMTTSGILTIATLLLFPFTIHPTTPRTTRVLSTMGLVPILISLWATVTRGAYLAVVAGLIFIAVVRNPKILILIILLLLVVIAFAPPYIESRIKSILDLNHPDNIARLQMWEAGIKIFKDHPIVGVGDIDTGKLMDRYGDPAMPRLWGHLHNTPLQILVNYGIIGFVILIGMFVKIITTEWNIYRRTKLDWFKGSFALGSLAAFIGFLVHGMTEWSFGDQELITLIWTTIGISISLGRQRT